MAINISDNNPRVNYTATSGQTVFTVPFEFFASTDLTVYVDGSVLAVSDYTVTGGSGSTGSITTDSGQTTGAKIAIVRDVPLERTTDLTSTYSASSLNDQLDRIVTQIADLDDRVSRSISLNDYEVGVSLDLPATASRLGKTIQFNSSTGALEVGPSGNELTSIASIASEITALDGIKTNITTVAGAITNVNSVGSNISSVTSVAGSISNVNTVNTNIANVNSVAGSISDLNDVADSLDQVELVGGSISNVDIVGPAIANVNTVAGDISNINTVAGISANITTVAGITAAISTVNSNATNINLVATNMDDVNDVANVVTKVTTVADNIANVNTVAPSVGYLSTVANNIANINTLAPISADITTVAGVASSVSSAAANAAAAESAKVAAEAAQAAAELAADNFDDTYLGAKSSNPTVDNDGDALTAGDLYFSTTDNNLKVYTGSAWQAAALDASGFVDVTGDTMTGNLLFGDGVGARFGTHGDLTFEHDLNNSNIVASNNKPLNITANGVFNINSDNIYFREHAASNTYMEMRDGGGYDHAVRIFHSGTDVRLETTSTGIDVTGTVTADGLTVDNNATHTFVLRRDNSLSPFASIDARSISGATTYYSGSLEHYNGQWRIQTQNTSTTRSPLNRATFDNNGDISFYEDTGTTAKFFWDASAESLGIGTTSPIAILDVKNATNEHIVVSGSSAYGNNAIVGVNDSGGEVGLGLGGSQIEFYTGATERMRIDSSGDLTVKGGRIFVNESDNGNTAVGITRDADEGYVQVYSAGSITTSIRGDGDSYFNGGNIGIGTSSGFGGKLDITLSTNARGYFSDSVSEVGSGNFALQVVNSAGSALKPLGFRAEDIRFATGSSERMTIDSAGTLILKRGTADAFLNPTGSALEMDVNRNPETGAFDDAGKSHARIRMDGAAGGSKITFNTASANNTVATERVRITSAGELLVGTTSTDPRNFSSGTYGIRLSDSQPEFGIGTMYINRSTGTDGDLISFRKDGATVGSIGTASGLLYIETGDAGLTFDNAGNRIFPSNDGAASDNKLDLGHSSARFKDLYLSGGVYLGGTGAANLLDDYEEGTWTPGVEFATVGSTATTANSVYTTGGYTKIGKAVTIEFNISQIVLGDGTGNLRLTGLPFTPSGVPPASGKNTASSGHLAAANTASGYLTIIKFYGVSTYNLMYSTGTGTSFDHITNSNASTISPNSINGSFTYYTNS